MATPDVHLSLCWPTRMALLAKHSARLARQVARAGSHPGMWWFLPVVVLLVLLAVAITTTTTALPVAVYTLF